MQVYIYMYNIQQYKNIFDIFKYFDSYFQYQLTMNIILFYFDCSI